MAQPQMMPPAVRPSGTNELVPTPQSTIDGFLAVRRFTEALTSDLDPEDCCAQSMPDCSPAKWHMAHTTWFFETFVLTPHLTGYEVFHPQFGYLFNSYYNGIGERQARHQRGLLTRPTLDQVLAYRHHVDSSVLTLLEATEPRDLDTVHQIVELGLHHEQQHQELMLTDLKHLFSQNILTPAYRPPLPDETTSPPTLGWTPIPEGLHWIGADPNGFHFDNETPAHRVFIEGGQIADRLITNGEYRRFIQDGGYTKPELWLDTGWATVRKEDWAMPLYWSGGPDGYQTFTLAGEQELRDHEPVSHISFLEAEAFARWAGARLPSEGEWEISCGRTPIEGNFVESGRYHPSSANPRAAGGPAQAYGDLWEWTRSSYGPYPGYQPEAGALGEYNGKFMCDQMVLRGGSCVSSAAHLRPSYRNFFYPPDRWQFSGIRLAKDAS
ncbi:MAG: ergothioneine biosynthesis protein EgtB [Myxococcota bacterium]|nr:ergothioneine biosynthesis protein EgtB [Myxococcota bacterium]